MSLLKLARAASRHLEAASTSGRVAGQQMRGMAGGHADIWKETKITPPEPSKTYLYVATAIGALFWSHVTIRMYNDGMDKFVGHHRNWVVDLENEKVYDIAHDDLESISDKALTDHAMIAKWAK